MHNAPGQRCLWTFFALAAGFLPFAPGLAWDRLIAPSETAANSPDSERRTAPTEFAKISDPSTGSATAREVYDLSLTESGGRWSLPVDSSTREWLVAVGITNPDSRKHRIRFEARTVPETNEPGNRKPGPRLLAANHRLETGKRHVVARHHGVEVTKSRIAPLPVRRFAIQTTAGDASDPAFYETVEGQLIETGERVAVYVDQKDIGFVDRGAIDMIVRTMDESIPARVESRIGGVKDIDGDGRVTILLSQALGRMADGSVVLDGFVRTSDFEKAGRFPRSHSCDMIYLNSRVQAGPFLKSLLAHEFTHAVIASARSVESFGTLAEPEESWLDEGLAHLSELWIDENLENLDYRIAAFLADPHEHRLIVNDQAGLASGRSHGHRGAAFLFMEWCQARFGDDLAGRLARSPKSGIANLEAATGLPFPDLFRLWTVDLLTQSAALGDPEALRSKALREDWLVGVPQAARIAAPIDDSPAIAEWEGQGTTVRFFRIAAAQAENHARELELTLESAYAARLQVTAIPLTGAHPGMSLEVLPVSEPGTDSQSAFRLRLTNLDETRPLTMQAAAWESAESGPDARALRDRRGMFDVLQLARCLGTVKIGPGQSVVSEPVEIAAATDRPEPMRWKAVAHDDRGRPVFARCETASAKPQRPIPARIAAEVPAAVRR